MASKNLTAPQKYLLDQMRVHDLDIHCEVTGNKVAPLRYFYSGGSDVPPATMKILLDGNHIKSVEGPTLFYGTEPQTFELWDKS